MTVTRSFAAVMAGLLLPIAAHGQGANARAAPGSTTADRLPIYEIDPTWPPTLPNDWILGDTRGLFVDDRDHLWVIHMPSSLTDQFDPKDGHVWGYERCGAGTAGGGPVDCENTPVDPVFKFDRDTTAARRR